jgi:hypothetical protein
MKEILHLQPSPLWVIYRDGFEQNRWVARPIIGWVGETAAALRPFVHVKGAVEIITTKQCEIFLREDEAFGAAKYWNGED